MRTSTPFVFLALTLFACGGQTTGNPPGNGAGSGTPDPTGSGTGVTPRGGPGQGTDGGQQDPVGPTPTGCSSQIALDCPCGHQECSDGEWVCDGVCAADGSVPTTGNGDASPPGDWEDQGPQSPEGGQQGFDSSAPFPGQGDAAQGLGH